MIRWVTRISLLMLFTSAGYADAQSAIVTEVLIVGTNDSKDKLPGSGIYIDAEQLEKHGYSDLNAIASQVPGVYVREEDGYGLRPNIGIRGATSDRSQKITLMEDGVLIAPAPYSAPAAYYITNPSRLHALEVLKGPSVIRSGPHTVGGAVNLLTRAVPAENRVEIDLMGGSDGYYKVEGAAAYVQGNFGLLLEGLSYGSDGFKELDDGGSTGFVRNDVNLKMQWTLNTLVPQTIVMKLGLADEDADETYLGLSDEDFETTSSRRYRASQLDRFQSEHQQLHVSYLLAIEDDLELSAKLYVNEFYRSWNKFSGFIDGPQAQDVLSNPSAYTSAYNTLTGQKDSLVGDFTDLTIDVTDNSREYRSQGLQIDLLQHKSFFGLTHAIRVGLRFHEDEVRRRHQLKGYLMRAGNLIYDEIPRTYKTDNFAHSAATALYVSDEIEWADWTFNLGVRHEDIRGRVDNFLTDGIAGNDQSITAPGIGLHRQLTERMSVFGGVYVGFSPSGPGKSGADAEESVNQEYGIRFIDGDKSAEMIAFRSDYDNLLGRCRASDSDCSIGEEFSGGQVEVEGIEVFGRGSWMVTDPLSLTMQLSYTYSDSAFKDTFFSQFSQWGLVRAGDELPYIPKHVGRLDVGVLTGQWAFDFAVKYQHQMREIPGSGAIQSALYADALTVVDVSVTRFVSDNLELKLSARNVSDTAKIVSHRPYGARPNAPRSLLGQVKYRFF